MTLFHLPTEKMPPGAFFKRAMGWCRRWLRKWSEQWAEGIWRAPLLFLAAYLVAGILLMDPASRWLGVISALLLGLQLVIFWQRRPIQITRQAGCVLGLSMLGFLALGAWRHAERRAEILSFPLAQMVAEGRSIDVSGEGWIVSAKARGEQGIAGLLELRQLVVGEHEVEVDHRLRFFARSVTEIPAYGEAVSFRGVIQPFPDPVVPGGFDARRFYFRESGSVAELHTHAPYHFQTTGESFGNPLVAVAERLRRKAERALLVAVAPEHEPYAALTIAMVLGLRDRAPPAVEDRFHESGTAHLFAVSGMHVGLVGGFALLICISCGMSLRWAACVVIPVVLFYALLTGLRPSAVRAAIMLSVFLAAYLFREKPRALNSLGLAAIILLVFDSQMLFLAGFQLSFCVVLVLILLAPVLHAGLQKPWGFDPFLPRKLLSPAQRTRERVVFGLTAMLAVSVASWLGSVFWTGWHFHAIAPIGIIANLFMIPIASAIVGAALCSLGISAIGLSWLAGLCNAVHVGLSFWLASFASFFAHAPGADIRVGQLDRNHTALRETIEEPETVLLVHVAGHERATASLIEQWQVGSDRARPEHAWLYDTGGDYLYRQQMLPLLRAKGWNQLDALALSHGDSSHMGAGFTVLQSMKPSFVWEPSAANRSPAYPPIRERLTSLERKKRLGRLQVHSRMAFDLTETQRVEVLWPPAGRDGRLADDRGMICRLTFAGRSILWSGDAGTEIFRELMMTRPHDLSADVWILGAHVETPVLPSPLLDPLLRDFVRPRILVIEGEEHAPSASALRNWLSDDDERILFASGADDFAMPQILIRENGVQILKNDL